MPGETKEIRGLESWPKLLEEFGRIISYCREVTDSEKFDLAHPDIKFIPKILEKPEDYGLTEQQINFLRDVEKRKAEEVEKKFKEIHDTNKPTEDILKTGITADDAIFYFVSRGNMLKAKGTSASEMLNDKKMRFALALADRLGEK